MAKIIVIMENAEKYRETAAMAGAFAVAARGRGHVVNVYDTANLKLYGCRACETCFKTGRPCSFNDDFNRISMEIAGSDGLVYAFPALFYTIPSKTKAFMDKFFSFYVTGHSFSGKKGGLISTCAEQGEDSFTSVRFMFEKSLSTLKMDNAGEVFVSGTEHGNASALMDGMARSAALAEQF